MLAASHDVMEAAVRGKLTRESLRGLMEELARSARTKRSYRIFLVGGGTAVWSGWRKSTIDANLFADNDDIFRNIQGIKERLQLNVEFVRPEDFVPPLAGSESRHIFIETIGTVSFYHYDPYAQLLSKVVCGFNRDLADAREFLASQMVEPVRFQALVHDIPESAYSKYPALSHAAVQETVDAFLSSVQD